MYSTLFVTTTLLLFVGYTTILLLYRKWFLQLQEFKLSVHENPQHKFTIIIPARNEAHNIQPCLYSILQQTYPKDFFEVIVIDDHSTDNTAEIVKTFSQQYANVTLIKLADLVDSAILNSFKKKAIEKAVGFAKYSWILTTDADCIVKPNWLATYNQFIAKTSAVFVAAPVVFTNNGSLVQTFQYLDFMALQGVTAASVHAGFHSMCNGANLAYRKDIFEAVGGFTGIDGVASGDDMLLMNKIKKQYPDKVDFLFSRDTIVATHPMPNWQSFFNQRIRWASKADQFITKDAKVFMVLVLVYLLNAALFIMPFMALVNIYFLLLWFALVIAKTVVETLFIWPVAKFFNQPFVWWFPFLQPLHIIYIVVSGWLGKFGTYQWKGRNVK